MTSIEYIKNNKEVSLLNFVNGVRSADYTVPEERGFLTTGNIGSLLNSSPCYLNEIHDGILINNGNQTDHSETYIGRIHPMKNDWVPLKRAQPSTPRQYCNEQPLSELLPYYPNTASPENPKGIPNYLLNPNCNLQLGGVAAPQVYGGTTAFVNNPDVVNNPYNDIGYELEPYGIAQSNGMRALSQGKNSCNKLSPGLNVPNLKTEQNNKGAFVTKPTTFNEIVPLYQTGDWTSQVPNNFLKNFNDNVGVGCIQ